MVDWATCVTCGRGDPGASRASSGGPVGGPVGGAVTPVPGAGCDTDT